ncbi:SNF2 domain-containing protein [Thiocapsa rosea]|uniref:SNF2 domain-containing protein n=1 Tax=Thiocapsa rosea TaxID=69360 RepID=A0A495V486_9GAMM|nr:SNF2 domain-containing protein [Thiocapsa rosea]
MQLEQLQPSAMIRGILPDALVEVVSVKWFGSEALELTYKTPTGKVANEILYRDDESRLELAEQGRPWSFDGDGALFRLVSEAHRIRLAHLFDPVLAVHTSLVDPLPHQVTAVYEAMLPRQPLRFLLADDPGAGNWFLETNLVIARLDKLSRNEEVQQKLKAPDCRWDLVVCDEAHKMSATIFGNEVKYTKRYRLGQLLSTLTRHFLLMSATPHNGKEEDFQLFMALLDGDRFEGKFRDGVHTADVSDLMRRMVKESLLKFDGTPLFPERIAHTVPYKLSDAEAALYQAVTAYVREEFNRAEAPENEVAALEETILDQATAARSIAELRIEIATLQHLEAQALAVCRSGTDTKWRELASLLGEIFTTAALADRAEEPKVPYGAGPIPPPTPSPHQKLVIFTEHRDTLNYLEGRITTLLGRKDAVVIIHGGIGREARLNVQESFKHDPRGPGPARHRRGRRGHQPAARASHGQLRPALESEPLGAALRAHPPHRPDRGVPSVEPGRRGDPRGRRLPPAAGEARAGAPSPRRAGLRRARQAPVRG